MRATIRAGLIGFLALFGGSCSPKLRSLPGEPAPAVFPRAELPPGRHRVVFRWEMEDDGAVTRGEGAARVAAPDSARLDFFLGGGIASGAAVLVGDTLRLPPGASDFARRLIPPATLLWAALGRLAIPPAPDTVARVDGDTLRADIGVPVAWRVTFVGDSLRRVERVEGGRVIEWVDRAPGAGRVRYRHDSNRRQLDLLVSRIDNISDFDPVIWAFQ